MPAMAEEKEKEAQDKSETGGSFFQMPGALNQMPSIPTITMPKLEVPTLDLTRAWAMKKMPSGTENLLSLDASGITFGLWGAPTAVPTPQTPKAVPTPPGKDTPTDVEEAQPSKYPQALACAVQPSGNDFRAEDDEPRAIETPRSNGFLSDLSGSLTSRLPKMPELSMPTHAFKTPQLPTMDEVSDSLREPAWLWRGAFAQPGPLNTGAPSEAKLAAELRGATAREDGGVTLRAPQVWYSGVLGGQKRSDSHDYYDRVLPRDWDGEDSGAYLKSLLSPQSMKLAIFIANSADLSECLPAAAPLPYLSETRPMPAVPLPRMPDDRHYSRLDAARCVCVCVVCSLFRARALLLSLLLSFFSVSLARIQSLPCNTHMRVEGIFVYTSD